MPRRPRVLLVRCSRGSQCTQNRATCSHLRNYHVNLTPALVSRFSTPSSVARMIRIRIKASESVPRKDNGSAWLYRTRSVQPFSNLCLLCSSRSQPGYSRSFVVIGGGGHTVCSYGQHNKFAAALATPRTLTYCNFDPPPWDQRHLAESPAVT